MTRPDRNPQVSPLSPRERVRVREDEPRHQHASLTTSSPGGGIDAVAIIGMAGQFPDAGDVETFWRNLVTGHDAVHPYSPPGSMCPHPRPSGLGSSKSGTVSIPCSSTLHPGKPCP